MKDYFFINTELLREYSRQVGLPTSRVVVSKKTKKVIVAANPKYERGSEATSEALSSSELAENFFRYCIQNGRVRFERPFVMESHLSTKLEEPFVLESVYATKVIFTDELVSKLPGIREMAVWISDPAPDQLTDEAYEWHGTFLLLPETNFDDGVYRTVLSGCSALQMLFNGLSGKELTNRDPMERLGSK